jgi:hypothetical protein
MKIYLHENRAERDVTLAGIEFTNGEAEVSDRDENLVSYLEKFYAVLRTAPAEAVNAAKAAKAAKAEKQPE